MNTTILNDPEYHLLPKGVRQMLLASESYFFEEGPRRPEGLLEKAAQQPRQAIGWVTRVAFAQVSLPSFTLSLRGSRRILHA